MMKLILPLIIFTILSFTFLVNGIFTSEHQINNITMNNIKLIDDSNNDVDIVNVNDRVHISAEITNNLSVEQAFSYVIYANKDDFNRGSWLSGSLSAGQHFTPTTIIISETEGTYQNTVFVFDRIDKGYRNLLAPSHNLSFTTGINSTQTNENDFTFTPTSETSPHSELTVNTNLEIINGEPIIITGNVSELSQIGLPSVNLFILSQNPSSFVYINSIPIRSDWTYEFEIDSSIFESGDYLLEINSGSNLVFTNISIISDIDEPEPVITIQELHPIVINNTSIMNDLYTHFTIIQQQNTEFELLIISLQNQMIILLELLEDKEIPLPQTIPILDNIAYSANNGTIHLSWDVISGEPIVKYVFKWRDTPGSWDKDIVRVSTLTEWELPGLENHEYEFSFFAANAVGNSEIEYFTLTP